jgi:hypothetical protein
MQTLPDYWFVYISENDAELPELTAISPPHMNRHVMSIDARKVLAAVGRFHAERLGQRLVFLADVTAWLHRDKGVEWGELDVDLDEAVATLHEGGPSILIEANATALAVAARGRADVCLVPSRPRSRTTVDFDDWVRDRITQLLENYWRTWPRRTSDLVGRRDT